MIDYTLVVGVDKKHLKQLSWVFPTWKKNKPSLLDHPMVVFYDAEEVKDSEIYSAISHPQLLTVPWPLGNAKYEGDTKDKFSNPQRYKMLSGFIYIPSIYVKTPYWLKLDTDTVATGQDNWIDSDWFNDNPAIVSQRWTFTKPPDQMMKLDAWVESNKDKLPELTSKEPLNLIPKPGASRVGHKRIISWCSFFNTEFTAYCAQAARLTCGDYKLPVPSQDGFVWYVAKRLGLGIKTANMKGRGWEHWSTEKNIRNSVEKALYNV